MAKSVTVIGAGIVGVCCALHLQREGFKVQLVDKGEPGMKASFGNSGSFGIASHHARGWIIQAQLVGERDLLQDFSISLLL